MDNFLVLIEENSENVPIDLHQELVAFPEPSVFMQLEQRWTTFKDMDRSISLSHLLQYHL